MAEDLQNPTWKYCVTHRTALPDVGPNRGKGIYILAIKKSKKYKFSALNMGLAIGTYMVHVCCWGGDKVLDENSLRGFGKLPLFFLTSPCIYVDTSTACTHACLRAAMNIPLSYPDVNKSGSRAK